MIQTDFDLKNKTVYQIGLGSVSWPQILSAMGKATQHPDFEVFDRMLWDFTDATPDIVLVEVDVGMKGLLIDSLGQMYQTICWTVKVLLTERFLATTINPLRLQLFLLFFLVVLQFHPCHQ